jgi:serine/alanine adding enzyme
MKVKEGNFSVVVIKDLRSTSYSDRINKFLVQSPYAHPKQSIAWALCKREFRQNFIVLTLENDHIYAYSLVYEHRSKLPGFSKYFVEGGPIVHSLDALPTHLNHLLQSLNNNGAWVKIRPYFTKDEIEIANKYLEQSKFISKGNKSSNYISTISVALDMPITQIKKGFRRSLKTQLNKASRLGLVPEYCNSDQIFLEFVDAYNLYAKNKNFGYIDHQEGLNIFNHFCKDGQSGCFIIIRENQKLLGGIVLLATGNSVFFEWGYSSHLPEHKKLPLGHVLQWKAINWAKEQKYEVYDFGGYWSERGDNDPINRFKTGFSKNILSVLPEYVYYLSPVYGRFIEILSKIKSLFRC